MPFVCFIYIIYIHRFRQALDRCFVSSSTKHLSSGIMHLSSRYQASVKQAPMKHLWSNHQASVKQPSRICQANTHAWWLLGTCLTEAWWLLDRCFVGACFMYRCLVHAGKMLCTAWQMLCAAWQMLEGMLDNQLSGIWHSAQSICQALDGIGGVL